MQENLYPGLISITMLDGDVDDLEFRIRLGYDINHDFLYSSSYIIPVESFVPYQLVWLLSGLFLIASGVYYENNRRRGAKRMLQSVLDSNKWND